MCISMVLLLTYSSSLSLLSLTSFSLWSVRALVLYSISQIAYFFLVRWSWKVTKHCPFSLYPYEKHLAYFRETQFSAIVKWDFIIRVEDPGSTYLTCSEPVSDIAEKNISATNVLSLFFIQSTMFQLRVSRFFSKKPSTV